MFAVSGSELIELSGFGIEKKSIPGSRDYSGLVIRQDFPVTGHNGNLQQGGVEISILCFGIFQSH